MDLITMPRPSEQGQAPQDELQALLVASLRETRGKSIDEEMKRIAEWCIETEIRRVIVEGIIEGSLRLVGVEPNGELKFGTRTHCAPAPCTTAGHDDTGVRWGRRPTGAGGAS